MIWQHEWIDWSLIGHILAFVDRSQHIWPTDSLFPELQNRIIPLSVISMKLKCSWIFYMTLLLSHAGFSRNMISLYFHCDLSSDALLNPNTCSCACRVWIGYYYVFTYSPISHASSFHWIRSSKYVLQIGSKHVEHGYLLWHNHRLKRIHLTSPNLNNLVLQNIDYMYMYVLFHLHLGTWIPDVILLTFSSVG